MGGKFSRDKGRREEQQLVLSLANMGFRAERILRQYQIAGQPDVKAWKQDCLYTFELKTRNSSYKTIYELYFSERGPDSILSFVLVPQGKAVAMSNRFESLLTANQTFRNLSMFPPDPKKIKTFKRILALDAERQTADFLVLKDNNKPRLYIRYYP